MYGLWQLVGKFVKESNCNMKRKIIIIIIIMIIIHMCERERERERERKRVSQSFLHSLPNNKLFLKYF
jgi:hypothetical protein